MGAWNQQPDEFCQEALCRISLKSLWYLEAVNTSKTATEGLSIRAPRHQPRGKARIRRAWMRFFLFKLPFEIQMPDEQQLLSYWPAAKQKHSGEGTLKSAASLQVFSARDIKKLDDYLTFMRKKAACSRLLSGKARSRVLGHFPLLCIAHHAHSIVTPHPCASRNTPSLERSQWQDRGQENLAQDLWIAALCTSALSLLRHTLA